MRITPSRFRATVGLAVALLVPLFPTTPARASGDPGVWQPFLPPPQVDGATAFDASRQRMYLFGGQNNSLVYTMPVGDSPAGWEVLAASGTPPAPRSAEAFVYDSVNDCLWVFGGKGYPGGVFNDLWRLSLDPDPTWTQVSASGSPPAARMAMGACYEEAQQALYIFGGEDGSGGALPNTLYRLELDQNPPHWSTPTQSGSVPSARYGFTICADPVNDRILFFGGTNGAFDTDDLFQLTVSTHHWDQLAASGPVPEPRQQHFTGVDSENQLLWVWGGTAGDGTMHALSLSTLEWRDVTDTGSMGPPGGIRPIGVCVPANPNWAPKLLLLDGYTTSEVYEFFYPDLDTAYWQNLMAPPPLNGASCVVDRARGKVYVHGGIRPFLGPSNSGWQYSLTGQIGWQATWLWSVTFNLTPPVSNHTAVWDDRRSRMLIFGGLDGTMANTNALSCMQDTLGFGWSWPTITATGTPPSPRHGMASIYDPAGDRMLIFGGATNSLLTTNDLFQLTLDPTPHWTQLSLPGAPPTRVNATAIFDEPRRRMIVFGGQGSSGLLNDVWAFNLASNSWTQLFPTGTSPASRYDHTAVYDLRRQRMLVHGGYTVGGNVGDTRELDLSVNPPAWSALTTTGETPIPRYQHVSAYDPAEDRMMVLGGQFEFNGCGVCPPVPLDGLATLDFGPGGVTAVREPETPSDPAGLAVGQPWPNPAQGVSRLSFQLAHDGMVRATVFDVTGRRVRVLKDGFCPAGVCEVQWDGRDAGGQTVATGLYLYQVATAGVEVSRKVWFVK